MIENKFYRLIGWEYKLGTGFCDGRSAGNEIVNRRYDYKDEDEKSVAYEAALSDLLKRVIEVDKDFYLCGTVCNHTVMIKSSLFKKPVVRDYLIESMFDLIMTES